MGFILPQVKVNTIIDKCQLFLSRDQVTEWIIAQLIGKLRYSAAAVFPAPLHYKWLQRHPQQIFVRPSQRNLVWPSRKWDHDYLGYSEIKKTQCESRSSVTVRNGYQQIETEAPYF